MERITSQQIADILLANQDISIDFLVGRTNANKDDLEQILLSFKNQGMVTFDPNFFHICLTDEASKIKEINEDDINMLFSS